MLINTHHHGDHTGGNQVFRASAKRIVGHVNCLAWHRKAAAAAKNEGQQSFADTTFTDQWRTDFGGETYPGALLRRRPHRRRRGHPLREGQRRAHGRPAVQPRPSEHRPAGRSGVANWITLLDKVASAHAADTIFIAGHAKDNDVQCAKAELRTSATT